MRGEFILEGQPLTLSAHPDLVRTMEIAALCNGAQLTRKESAYTIVGDPTEGALLPAAAKIGIAKEDKEEG